MDYEKKYKEALERAKVIYQGSYKPDTAATIAETLQNVFPELRESEDERIRKAIHIYLDWLDGHKDYQPKGDYTIKDMIAWLEKQGEQEQLYIRFGEIPTDEKSKIFQGEIEVGTENGVSVYPAFKTSEGDIVLGLSLPITKTTLYTQQHLIEYDDRPCYLVRGDYVGKDTDGQPLINNVSIIEKIDTYRVKEKKQREQKLAWSEEDKKLTDVNHEYFSELLENNNSKDINDYAYQVAYCMSHDWANETPIWDDVQKACKLGAEWKEKHCNNSSTAWSEEDENTIKVLMNIIKKSEIIDSIIYTDSLKEKLYDWLKSLRPQPKQEWSEEDELKRYSYSRC